jgi:hypothetical protein
VQHWMADSSAIRDQSDIRLFIVPSFHGRVNESIAYVTNI